MANRDRTNTAAEMARNTDVPNTQSLLSTNKSRPNEKNDDIIVSLEERYENRRARQVGEWERLYGANVYRAI